MEIFDTCVSKEPPNKFKKNHERFPKVCAVSALSEGTIIGRKSYESNAFCHFDGGARNGAKGSLPRVYHVGADCDSSVCAEQKVTNRTSCCQCDCVNKQCKNSRSSSYSVKENVSSGKEKEPPDVGLAFRKRKLLWTGTTLRPPMVELSEEGERCVQQECCCLMCKSENPKYKLPKTKRKRLKGKCKENESSHPTPEPQSYNLDFKDKKKFLRLKHLKSKPSKRNLDKVKIDDELDLNKRIEKLVGEIAAENKRIANRKLVEAENALGCGRAPPCGGKPGKIVKKPLAFFKCLKNLFRFRKGKFKNKKVNVDNQNSVPVNMLRGASPVAYRAARANSFDVSKALRKTRFRRNPYRSSHSQYDYPVTSYRERLNTHPYSTHFKGKPDFVIPFSRHRLHTLIRRRQRRLLYRSPNGLKRPPFYTFPRRNVHDVRSKRHNRRLLEQPYRQRTSFKEQRSAEENAKRKQDPSDETDSPEVKATPEEPGKGDPTASDFGLGSKGIPDHTLEKPFLEKDLRGDSLNNYFKTYEARYNLQTDFPLFTPTALHPYRRSKYDLPHNGYLNPYRYLKIRHALRNYLIHNNILSPRVIDSFVGRKKRCGEKCCPIPHKCWRSPPLLCIPYIRKGQDDLLRYLIRTLQKMIGKPLSPRFDIFENTKYKPCSKKDDDNNDDDEEYDCCSTCVLHTPPPCPPPPCLPPPCPPPPCLPPPCLPPPCLPPPCFPSPCPPPPCPPPPCPPSPCPPPPCPPSPCPPPPCPPCPCPHPSCTPPPCPPPPDPPPCPPKTPPPCPPPVCSLPQCPPPSRPCPCPCPASGPPKICAYAQPVLSLTKPLNPSFCAPSQRSCSYDAYNPQNEYSAVSELYSTSSPYSSFSTMEQVVFSTTNCLYEDNISPSPFSQSFISSESPFQSPLTATPSYDEVNFAPTATSNTLPRAVASAPFPISPPSTINACSWYMSKSPVERAEYFSYTALPYKPPPAGPTQPSVVIRPEPNRPDTIQAPFPLSNAQLNPLTPDKVNRETRPLNPLRSPTPLQPPVNPHPVTERFYDNQPKARPRNTNARLSNEIYPERVNQLRKEENERRNFHSESSPAVKEITPEVVKSDSQQSHLSDTHIPKANANFVYSRNGRNKENSATVFKNSDQQAAPSDRQVFKGGDASAQQTKAERKEPDPEISKTGAPEPAPTAQQSPLPDTNDYNKDINREDTYRCDYQPCPANAPQDVPKTEVSLKSEDSPHPPSTQLLPKLDLTTATDDKRFFKTKHHKGILKNFRRPSMEFSHSYDDNYYDKFPHLDPEDDGTIKLNKAPFPRTWRGYTRKVKKSSKTGSSVRYKRSDDYDFGSEAFENYNDYDSYPGFADTPAPNEASSDSNWIPPSYEMLSELAKELKPASENINSTSANNASATQTLENHTSPPSNTSLQDLTDKTANSTKDEPNAPANLAAATPSGVRLSGCKPGNKNTSCGGKTSTSAKKTSAKNPAAVSKCKTASKAKTSAKTKFSKAKPCSNASPSKPKSPTITASPKTTLCDKPMSPKPNCPALTTDAVYTFPATTAAPDCTYNSDDDVTTSSPANITDSSTADTTTTTTTTTTTPTTTTTTTPTTTTTTTPTTTTTTTPTTTTTTTTTCAPTTTTTCATTSTTTCATTSTTTCATTTTTESVSDSNSTSCFEGDSNDNGESIDWKKSGKTSFFQTNSKTVGIQSNPKYLPPAKLSDLASDREDKRLDGNQDLDIVDDGQVPTTLKTATIVKGPKKSMTKPSPKVYTRVYPDSIAADSDVDETTTTAAGTTVKPVVEKTPAPNSDAQLQLLAVCEGYLEVVKLIKAQNQTLGEDLDAELARYCESIISQNFNLQSEPSKAKKQDFALPSPPAVTAANASAETAEGAKSGDDPDGEAVEKDLQKKVILDMLNGPLSKRQFARGKKEKKRRKKKKKGGAGRATTAAAEAADEVTESRLRRKKSSKSDDDGPSSESHRKKRKHRRKEQTEEEMLKKGIEKQRLELLRLLKKRKRALLSYLYNTKIPNKRSDAQGVEYFDEDEEVGPGSNMSSYSGTVTTKEYEETSKTTVSDKSFVNETVFPVYAKEYGYDRGGELTEVEVLWRKINEKTHEKKIFKNLSVLALLLTSTSEPNVNRVATRFIGSGLEREDLSEIQSKSENKAGFADAVANLNRKTSTASTEIESCPSGNNTYTFISKPDPKSIVGTPPNCTVLHPNTTHKVPHKFGVAKDLFQEYTIEFLNYAVYILPIMFTVLFFFCCLCCAVQIFKSGKTVKKCKKKKKRQVSSESETTESEPESKKKRREGRRKKHSKANADYDALTKNRSKTFWNVLKLNSGKNNAEFNDENQTEKKKSFLRFLKCKKEDDKEFCDQYVAVDCGEADENSEDKLCSSGESKDTRRKKDDRPKTNCQSEADERRELIALLEELKKIETENTADKEKKDVKSVHVQYMTQEEDTPVFQRPEFGFQKNVFGMPKGCSPCNKHFPFYQSDAAAVGDYELFEDVNELTELLPCDCNYYAKRNDYLRQCDFKMAESGCESLLKIFRDTGVTRSAPFREKNLLKNASEKRSFIFNKYRSISTDASEELMGVTQKNAGTEVGLADNVFESASPLTLQSKKNGGLVEEMDSLKRQLNNKKHVRLKDNGVLCRL